jgi:NAD(P)H-dependent flavin oxidoreductase YrpB (nitropropane dioxygenase family)
VTAEPPAARPLPGSAPPPAHGPAASGHSPAAPAQGPAASAHGPAAPLRTRLTELTGISYPIVQTGMGFVAGTRLVAATSAAGGLGIIGSATMTLAELRTSIAGVKERTDRPFGVNLRADGPDAADRIKLMIAEGVRVASFALAPKQEMIRQLKDAGVIVIPSVGARRHAEKVAQWGADAVIVQGGEGGGHTGPIPTSLLLPQVVSAVDIPVVAAGGFFDGRGLVAALAYGAEGIAMGTRFLLTSDSPVADEVKQVYLSKTLTDTVVTTRVDGVPHRVLRTPLIDGLERSGQLSGLIRAVRNAAAFRGLSGLSWRQLLREGAAMRGSSELSWSQVLMAANTPMLLKAAMVDGRPDVGVMAAGQVVGLIDDVPSCAELIDRIMTEAAAVLARLSQYGFS